MEQKRTFRVPTPQEPTDWNSRALAEFSAWACQLECLVLMDHCWNEADFQDAFSSSYGSDACSRR